MRRTLLVKIFPLLMLVSSMAWAQSRTVSGKVTSAEDGSALPGVNVVIKGTSTGATTDADGAYQLSIPDNNAVLVFSFIGLTSQEIQVGDKTVVDVPMANDITQLGEVVVVGYGTQERSKLSSSVSSISGSAIGTLASPSFDTQLGGRAAGVQVSVGSGIIGQAPVINIRGVNSLTQGTFPLVVIDNVPMITGNQSGVTPTNPLADINMTDIESYEILKDGAATAIYGSRAANGVILITTKRGTKEKGKMKVDFTTSTGFSEAGKKFDLLNANQFVTIANEKLATNGIAPQAFMDAKNTNTNWMDVLFHKGSFSNYNLNFSGSTDKTNYYFSVGYQFQESAVVSNKFERLSFRTNLDHKVNKFIEVGTGLNVSHSNTFGLNTGSGGLSGNISAGLRLLPNVPVYDPLNPTGYNLSSDGSVLGPDANTRQIDNNYTNLKFVFDNNKFQASTNRVIANVYGKINIIDGLFLRTQYAVDYLGNNDFQSLDPRSGDGRGSNGLVFQQFTQVPRWNWQNTLNFNRDFGSHNVNVVLGVENQKTTSQSFFGQGTTFSDRYFIQNSLISGTYSNQFSGGGYSQQGFSSYFGRVNYSFKDKYLLTFSARNDGLSNLPSATRRGNFFGGSIGYRVSEEEFYKNSSIANILNSLKLRASYAQVGNSSLGSAFPYAALYGSAQYGLQNGVGFSQAANPNLKWETSKKTNVGGDFGFLNNRITFSADYFINNIDGNILNAPISPSIGIPNNSIAENIGVLKNSGLELTLSATVINRNGLTWTASPNFTFVKSDVKALVKDINGVDQPIIGATNFLGVALPYSIITVGASPNSIYGYRYAGVNSANGNPMYYKGDGTTIIQRDVNSGAYSFYNSANPTDQTNTSGAALNPADVKNGGDRRLLGQTLPKWFGGFSNTVSYKGFTLDVLFRFQGGNKIYNQTRQDNLLNQDFNNNGTEILNRWTPDNKNTSTPALYIGHNAQVNQSGNAISRFVESGDFLRIQNIALSYSLPKSLLEKTGNFKVSSVRLFVQAQNAFTFTKYKGADPELGQGFDNNTSPIFKTYTFGVNIGL